MNRTLNQKIAGPKPCYDAKLVSCPKCPYGGPRVGSRGNPAAPIVFVAEAPGDDELIRKLPLTGPSGHLFWSTLPAIEALREMGIDVDNDVLILNAMQCRPPRKKDDAKYNQEMVSKGRQACSDRLLWQIKRHPRKLIVAMGNSALHTLAGDSSLKITQIRGRPFASPLAARGIMPVVHPAAVLRGTGNFRQFREDLAYAMDIAAGLPFKRPMGTAFKVHKTFDSVWAFCNSLISKINIKRSLGESIFPGSPHLWDIDVSCDIETTGFDRTSDRIISVGFCLEPSRVDIIPENMIPFLRPLLMNFNGRFIFHNGKFDIAFLRRDFPDVPQDLLKVDEDTMLMSYAIDENPGVHSLEELAKDVIGADDYKHVIRPYLKGKGKTYDDIPKTLLYRYQALDCSNTKQIHSILRHRIRADHNLEKLYTKVLLPMSELFYWVERRGIEVHKGCLDRNKKRLQKGIEEAQSKIDKVCAKYNVQTVNTNSPKQLAVLLFDQLKLVPERKGERSTAKDVLDYLYEKYKHPVIKAIQDHRKAAKAKGTYADGIEKAFCSDGFIHSTYLIHGTRTGRLSSREPNMQNIPRDRKIRGQFVARKGYVFVKVDLNQAELRSLAALSGDDFLCEIYRDGRRSLHKETAEEFYPGWKARMKEDPGSVQCKEELMRAKAVNFGIVYGRTAESIAEEFGISVSEAQRFIDKWAQRSPKAWRFIERCRRMAILGRTMITQFGRKKRHWVISSENAQAMMNEASNFPHQSIASDITVQAAIEVAPILRERDVWAVNLVHDEIMVECPDTPEMIEWTKETIISSMESIPARWGITRIPFKAEADVGKRWSIWREAA